MMHMLEWLIDAMNLQKNVILAYRWQDIECVRQDVVALVATTHNPCFEPERVGMVAAELLENAIAHGDSTCTKVHFSLKQKDDCLHIRVRNHVKHADDANKINRLLAWIGSCENKRVAYQTLLLQAFNSYQASGGVGLARIVYEGHCELTCNTEEDREIEMHAILKALPVDLNPIAR